VGSERKPARAHLSLYRRPAQHSSMAAGQLAPPASKRKPKRWRRKPRTSPSRQKKSG